MTQLFNKFSSKENLKKAYDYVKKELASSSLSVNPINHPAITSIDGLGDQFFDALEKYLRDGKYKPEEGFFVYIPKDNLGLRPVCILSMVDRIVYQAIFNQGILGNKIDSQLSDSMCLANRVNENVKSKRFLFHYKRGWNAFCSGQKKAFDSGYAWKVEFDVQQYYEHIPISKVIEILKKDFSIKDQSILEILEKQLCSWTEHKELHKGIPQGPEASAVIANAYLCSLDEYVENELKGTKLKYFRYADDMVLMGKDDKHLLEATEKIVRFLRKRNLSLNEKTKIAKLEDTKEIEAMRFFSNYGDTPDQIPEDEFTRIAIKAPQVIENIRTGERVEKIDISELKYYLKVCDYYNIGLAFSLVEIIPLKPSLIAPIIQYLSECKEMFSWLNLKEHNQVIDTALWGTYKKKGLSEWSKFWILKLLVSDKNLHRNVKTPIGREIKKFFESKDNQIFKITGFYYQIIQGRDIELEQVKTALKESETNIEKSLFSFFLLNTFNKSRPHTVKNWVEKMLGNESHEINTIGAFILKNQKISEVECGGIFAKYLLNIKTSKKKPEKTKVQYTEQVYAIKASDLMPLSQETAKNALDIKRPKQRRCNIDLHLPEKSNWDKIEIKIKKGQEDVQILYNKQHIVNTDYKELGFGKNKKNIEPNIAWHFLCILSVLQKTDIKTATPDNLMPMIARHTKRVTGKNNIYAIKNQLSKQLREVFYQIEDPNPFYENKQFYEPKFAVQPEPDLRNEEVWRQGGSLNENIDYEE